MGGKGTYKPALLWTNDKGEDSIPLFADIKR